MMLITPAIKNRIATNSARPEPFIGEAPLCRAPERPVNGRFRLMLRQPTARSCACHAPSIVACWRRRRPIHLRAQAHSHRRRFLMEFCECPNPAFHRARDTRPKLGKEALDDNDPDHQRGLIISRRRRSSDVEPPAFAPAVRRRADLRQLEKTASGSSALTMY